MATSVAALLLACAAFAYHDVYNFRQTVLRETETLAQILSDASQAALAFQDAKAAQETLAILKAEPRILGACSYGIDGGLMAAYARESEVPCPEASPRLEATTFQDNRLTLAKVVALDRQRVGWVLLVADMSELRQRLIRYGIIVALVLAASLLLALIISSGLQKLISRPVLQLAETAGLVSSRQDYTIRATKLADDEIGLLVERFNEMLDQIRLRDEELQKAHGQLEARVVERTAELQREIGQHEETQRKLLDAKLAAEESNRAKSAFLANMSHELRTPLNAIIGYSEMLQEDCEAMDLREFGSDLGKIRNSGKHLLALINDVLDISKIEAGKMTISLEEVVVGHLVHDVAATVEPLARKNGNRLLVVCDMPDLTVQADAMRLRQALLNLSGNACKFTRDGEVRLEVRKTFHQGVPWLHLRVCDTGIGIAPDQVKKLFQAFSQVDSSATRRFEGTGLGLAISRRLCQMMGGDITVESEPGKGSVFTIALPLGAPPETAGSLESLRQAVERAARETASDAAHGLGEKL